MHTNCNKILVVGGAGYIGSHMVLALKDAGFQPIVLDNLSKGRAHAVIDAELIVGDMAEKDLLRQLFTAHQFTAVIHFASLIEVAESVKFPEKYYRNNVVGTLYLLEAMIKNNVKKFIFSSSAAVYGEPQYTPIDETHPLNPLTPYGRSKWMVEAMIKDFAASAGLKYAILRYFNAAGADPKARLGECHSPESHLIPLVLQVAAGECENITVYGRDYPTSDGTCIRDFVHVSDLVQAHLLTLEALCNGQENIIYNLGIGQGYSVQQVIDAVQVVTKRNIATLDGARRLGDPAILVANSTKVMHELKWRPQYTDLHTMIDHAWQFMNPPDSKRC